MPELRLDQITGRRVYIAEDRAGRPTDYALAEATGAAPRGADAGASQAPCPFCAGNEAATPFAAATVLDAQGAWTVRVVPNKFPAMTLEAGADSALGSHEVIIESPRHVLDVTELEVEELTAILGTYRDRLRHWAADSRLVHGLVFKNSGYAAGASLRHVHSQLVALPYVPEAVQVELESAQRYHSRNGQCVFCDLIRREIASGERIVTRRHGLVSVCAYAGRQPFETWILPEEHRHRFDAAIDSQASNVAEMLHGLLRALHATVPGVAYNLILHSGPFDERAADFYHWHWELVPRIAQFAGFELGTGVFINPLSPERAAQRLRQA